MGAWEQKKRQVEVSIGLCDKIKIHVRYCFRDLITQIGIKRKKITWCWD